MPGLSGLAGLYQSEDLSPSGTIDEGALEARANPVRNEHGKTGDTSGEAWPAGYGLGWGGQGTYYEGDSDTSNSEYDYPGVNYSAPPISDDGLDDTPTTHKGLWPVPMATSYSTVNPDDFANVNPQLGILHGSDQGGVRAYVASGLAGLEYSTDYTTDRYDAPNDTALSANIPGQLKQAAGGRGSADATQGYGSLNSVPEFQAGHSIRRVQHDSTMFDYTNLHGEEGVWLGKHAISEHQFDGPDSPYSVYGDSSTGVQRAGNASTLGYPTVMASPPSPTVTNDVPGQDVWAYAY